MKKLFKTLSISLIAAAAMTILPSAQVSAAVSTDLGTHHQNLFGFFGCCCDSCDTCDSCRGR